MRIRRTAIAALFLCIALAAPARAEFSAQEKAELAKFVEAFTLVNGDAFEDLARSFDETGGAMQDEHGEIMGRLAQASDVAHLAMSIFANAQRIDRNKTRAQNIVEAIRRIGSMRDHVAKTLERVEELPDNRYKVQVTKDLTEAVALLDDFDDSLSYLDFRPPGYPAKIFPHGDYDRAQHNFTRIGRYGTAHTIWNVSKFLRVATTPNFPAAARPIYIQMAKGAADSMSKFIRAWGLSLGVELAGDTDSIDREFRTSGKSRPRSFFVSELQFEILHNKGKVAPNISTSGRKLESGMAGELARLAGSWAAIQRHLTLANGTDWLVKCMEPGNITMGDSSPESVCYNLVTDIFDFWRDLDGWVFSELGRFHGPFGPPPDTGPPTTCADQVTSHDVVIDGEPVVCEER